MEQQLFWRAASEGKTEQAYAFLARVKSADERAGMLLQLARITSGKGNTAAAIEYLDEAWNLVGGRARGQSQFSAQLQLGLAYAPLAPARAFEIVEAGVAHLNELVAAASVLEGFSQEFFTQDELQGPEGHVWGALAMQCNETLAALSSLDFNHARSAADRLQRPELRLPARLAVARGVLFKEKRDNFKLRPMQGRGGARTALVINED